MGKEYSITQLVVKLVGPVMPVGETTEDNKRFENLKDLILLTDNLLSLIVDVSKEKDRQEYSISRAGKEAHRFIQMCKNMD